MYVAPEMTGRHPLLTHNGTRLVAAGSLLTHARFRGRGDAAVTRHALAAGLSERTVRVCRELELEHDCPLYEGHASHTKCKEKHDER